MHKGTATLSAYSSTPALTLTESSLLSISGSSGNFNTVVSDFTGDGISDMAVVAVITTGCDTTCVTTYTLSVYVGNGDGTFTLSGSPIAVDGYNVAVGDFNADNKMDLALSNFDADTVAVLLENGDATFTAASYSPVAGLTQGSALYVGDFNGDGIADIAEINNMAAVQVLLGSGSGFTLASSPFSPPGCYLSAGVAGDYNGDGLTDLAVTCQVFSNSPGSATVLLSNGDGSFSEGSLVEIGKSTYQATAGDFNGDGKLDFAVLNGNSNNMMVLLNQGITLSGGTVSGTFSAASGSPYSLNGSNPDALRTGDFNGDGYPDLVVGTENAGYVSLFLNAGDGTFTNSFNKQPFGNVEGLTVGDFDGNGKTDVAVWDPFMSTNNLKVLMTSTALTASAYLNNVVMSSGAHTLMASYAGDSTYGASSATTSVIVPLLTPTFSLQASANPSTVGSAITFTSTVSGPSSVATPTGTVTFKSGSTDLCTAVALSSGVATCAYTSSTAGSLDTYAVYSGDTVYLTKTSSTQAMNIVAAPATSSTGGTSFGSVNVGSSANATITITFSTAKTLGGISVRTQGGANLDYTLASGGSCQTGTQYVANATCTVVVTFSPKHAGTRSGAVVISDSSTPANVIGTAYLTGIGVGAQIAFQPGTQTQVGSFYWPYGVAVDADGNVFVADNNNSSVYMENLQSDGSYVETEIGSGFYKPNSVAVDGAGNVYVADFGGVYMETLQSDGSYLQASLGSGWSRPAGIAVDGSGNVYVADLDAGVFKLALSNGSYLQSSIGSGFALPKGVAVDRNGNVYVSDFGNLYSYKGGSISGNVYKETLSDGLYTQSAIGSDWLTPYGIAVDGNGNIYVADNNNYENSDSRVVKETLQSNGTYTQAAMVTSISDPTGVAVDGSGNLYVVDSNSTNVYKFDVTNQTAVSFEDTTKGNTSIDSPKTITIFNSGNAAFSFSALSYPTANFPEVAGVATDCTSSTSLAANGSCTLSINFTPTDSLGSSTSALVSGNVSFTTNLSATAQNIAVSGIEAATSTADPVFSVPSGTYSTMQTVSITDTTDGAAIYYTTDGTTPTTSSNVYTDALIIGYSQTIKAFALLGGNGTSKVVTAVYRINPTDTPTFTPVAGSYGSAQTVTISDTTPGAVIYYTLNGSKPDCYESKIMKASRSTIASPLMNYSSNCHVYSAPIIVSSSETIRAIAMADGYNPSDIASAAYVIDPSLNTSTAEFTVDTSTSAATVQPGGSATFAFTFAPDNGSNFTTAVTFAASGLPSGATAVFSPTSIAAGSGATTVTLTIQLPQTTAMSKIPDGSLASRLAPISLALLLLPLAGKLRKTGKRLGRMLSVLLLLAGMAGMGLLSGCGSTSGFFGQAQKNYTVTVTATSGTVSHSTNVNLTVE